MTRTVMRALVLVVLMSLIIVLAALMLGRILPSEQVIFSGIMPNEVGAPTDWQLIMVDTTHGLSTRIAENSRVQFFVSSQGRVALLSRDTQSIISIDVYGRQQWVASGTFEIGGWLTGGWSPDGSRLAFAAADIGRYHSSTRLYVAEDGVVHNLMPEESFRGINEFMWSPHGETILFMGIEANNSRSGIYIIELGSGAIRKLSPDDLDASSPAWSPDGTRIVFSGFVENGRDIFVMNADGSEVVNLTQNPNSVELSPIWSPDGTRIAYLAYTEAYFGILQSSGLYVMNVESFIGNELVNSDWQISNPRWSPDGESLAFEYGPPESVRQIYTIDAAGGTMRRVSYMRSALNPEWLP